MEKEDPRIVNLTPYTLDMGETIIPFSGMVCVYHRDGLLTRGGPSNWVDDMLFDTTKTFIVTENVGLLLSDPDNASSWKGRVVGPEKLMDVGVDAASRPLSVKILPGRKWVMYKDANPPLKEVVFNPDRSCSPFTVVDDDRNTKNKTKQ